MMMVVAAERETAGTKEISGMIDRRKFDFDKL